MAINHYTKRVHRLKMGDYENTKKFVSIGKVNLSFWRYMFGTHKLTIGGTSWRYVHLWPIVIEWRVRP